MARGAAKVKANPLLAGAGGHGGGPGRRGVAVHGGGGQQVGELRAAGGDAFDGRRARPSPATACARSSVTAAGAVTSAPGAVRAKARFEVREVAPRVSVARRPNA